MTTKTRFIRAGKAALAITLLAPGCSNLLTQSATNSFVIIDSLQASTGREPDKISGMLNSDVLTYVKKDVDGKSVAVPTIFADNLIATFLLGMKDPGSVEEPTKPTAINYITITRYRVKFVRSDGRNTEGVDVPYGFDGGVTVTVTPDRAQAVMTLVREQSKSEAPLSGLIGSFGPGISTIAEVTFYGKDGTGRDIQVVGKISVNFADWGDPA
jgi:hypothetical protein